MFISVYEISLCISHLLCHAKQKTIRPHDLDLDRQVPHFYNLISRIALNICVRARPPYMWQSQAAPLPWLKRITVRAYMSFHRNQNKSTKAAIWPERCMCGKLSSVWLCRTFNHQQADQGDALLAVFVFFVTWQLLPRCFGEFSR